MYRSIVLSRAFSLDPTTSECAPNLAVTLCLRCGKNIQIDPRSIPTCVRVGVICSSCEQLARDHQEKHPVLPSQLSPIQQQQQQLSLSPPPIQQYVREVAPPSHTTNITPPPPPPQAVSQVSPHPPPSIPLVVCMLCQENINIDVRFLPPGVQVVCSKCEQKSLKKMKVKSKHNNASKKKEPGRLETLDNPEQPQGNLLI